jgi:hypothetical protein
MASDQYQLALTVGSALTGEMPNRPGGIRDTLPGVPGTVVSVLARATATRPDERFPDLYAFARAFDESITSAGEDLIAGVWEATSRGDNALAAIMLEMAQDYAPDHRDLPVLRIRMTGGSAVDVSSLAGMGLVPSADPKPKANEQPAIVVSTPEEAEIAAMLLPPKPANSANPKPKSNPWVAFAAGTFACLILLVLATALTLAYL